PDGIDRIQHGLVADVGSTALRHTLLDGGDEGERIDLLAVCRRCGGEGGAAEERGEGRRIGGGEGSASGAEDFARGRIAGERLQRLLHCFGTRGHGDPDIAYTSLRVQLALL